jgi:hypothetical protein
MGVAPEATAKCLYLVVGSPFYHLVAILSTFHFSIFIGCAASAPDGSSPRGYSQVFILGCRLMFLSFLNQLHIKLLIKSSPRAFEQILVFDQRLTDFFYLYCRHFSYRYLDKKPVVISFWWRQCWRWPRLSHWKGASPVTSLTCGSKTLRHWHVCASGGHTSTVIPGTRVVAPVQ